MNENLNCPDCGRPVERQGQKLCCTGCSRIFNVRPLCPQCERELDVLKACGAVDYFCTHCKALQSRRSILRQLVPA